MPKVNYERFKETASDMIRQWGMRAVLRRNGAPDRWCDVVITYFTPYERTGQMRDPLDRKVLLSVDGLAIPPDKERDRLVTYVQPLDEANPVEDETLRIVEIPGKIEMAGNTVLYRLAVRK